MCNIGRTVRVEVEFILFYLLYYISSEMVHRGDDPCDLFQNINLFLSYICLFSVCNCGLSYSGFCNERVGGCVVVYRTQTPARQNSDIMFCNTRV